MSRTQLLTMANIKPEDAENSLWQGYSLQTPTSAAPHTLSYETNYPQGPPAMPYHQRPQKGNYRSLDIPSMQARPLPRDGTGVLTASPPSLNTHHSYPSLKRTFHSTEESQYGEIVQEFREEMAESAKPSINQDHRLLSFSKLTPKQAVVDSHGRVHQIELSAQIHGMFFLSEMTTPSGEGLVQPELTCYRRNLFQISGTVTTPRGSLSVITERGERVPVMSSEVVISASESVDGHAVKLIVIPWKTPPPNSPEVGPGQESEPSPIPLLPFDQGVPDTNNDFSVYPIAFRRLQFRIATANNGRRRELQQHFTLHLNVVATLANGTKTNICETSTAPIVVRGRSPRNFQARKEIPLVGSSSSRGGPPELHISTSIGVNVAPTSSPAGKVKVSKPQTMELPRPPFNFDTSNIPASPALMRTSTYPTYLPSHTEEHSTGPNTPSYQAPIGLENYLPVSHSNADISSSSTIIPRSQPAPQQYTFQTPSNSSHSGSQIRFIDNNPRPAKSPRHVAPPELPTSSYNDYSARFAPPYNNPGDGLPPRDSGYFSTSLPMHQAWSAPSDTSGTYGTSLQGAPSGQHYQFPTEGYVKEENNQQQNYTWNNS